VCDNYLGAKTAYRMTSILIAGTYVCGGIEANFPSRRWSSLSSTHRLNGRSSKAFISVTSIGLICKVLLNRVRTRICAMLAVHFMLYQCSVSCLSHPCPCDGHFNPTQQLTFSYHKTLHHPSRFSKTEMPPHPEHEYLPNTSLQSPKP